MTGSDEATLTAIETALEDDGVWVAPELATQVTAAGEQQIEQAVAKAAHHFYVVLAQPDADDPLLNGRPEQLTGLIYDDIQAPGIYLGMELTRAGEPPELRITERPEQNYGYYVAARIARLEHPDDLAAATITTIELIDSGADLDAKLEQAQAKDPELYERLYGYQTGGGSRPDHGGNALPAVGGVLAVALVGIVVTAWLRRRRRGGSLAAASTSGRALALPEAVLRTVRAAEDERNESRAQSAVLKLGEAIDAAELSATSARARASWRAALDHYDVASRIMDRQHSPADAVGALVLAERGEAALQAAVKGRGWSPGRRCYFNPLHGPATTTATWSDGGRSVKVPSCEACTRALRAGQEPPDILDFVADGEPRHYFRLDLGAWSRTGFGALDPDLLPQLLRR